MKEFLEQNKWIVGLFIGMLGIGASYLEWRVSVIVSSKIESNGTVVAAGQVSPDRISAIEGNVSQIRTQHIADTARMDGKVERIVDILLEE